MEMKKNKNLKHSKLKYLSEKEQEAFKSFAKMETPAHAMFSHALSL